MRQASLASFSQVCLVILEMLIPIKGKHTGVRKDMSFVHSFTHSFSPQIFTESLLGSRHHSSSRNTMVIINHILTQVTLLWKHNY